MNDKKQIALDSIAHHSKEAFESMIKAMMLGATKEQVNEAMTKHTKKTEGEL